MSYLQVQRLDVMIGKAPFSPMFLYEKVTRGQTAN